MPILVKEKYLTKLAAKLAEMEGMSDDELVVALNAPVPTGEKTADGAEIVGPSWGQSVGIGHIHEEFIGHVREWQADADVFLEKAYGPRLWPKAQVAVAQERKLTQEREL